MSAKVTEEAVVSALRRNSEFTKAPDDYNLTVFRPYVSQLIKCTATLGLDTPTTWPSIATVVVQFTQKLLDGGYLQDMEEEHRQHHGLTPEFLRKNNIQRVAPFTRALERTRDAYERSRARHPRWLKEEGLTEQQFMESDHMSLNPTALQLCRNNQLTLGKLLVTQPEVLTPEPYDLFPWNSALD